MADGYARPDVLVDTQWVADHLNDPGVRIVESDEDVLLYETGHIPNAIKVDWHTDLQKQIERDFITKDEFEALVGRCRPLDEELRKTGQVLLTESLEWDVTTIRARDGKPVTTDGPLPETSDLVAGWYLVDVESYERALELAAYLSSEPGPGGEPLYEWIDVREVMSETPMGT